MLWKRRHVLIIYMARYWLIIAILSTVIQSYSMAVMITSQSCSPCDCSWRENIHNHGFSGWDITCMNVKLGKFPKIAADMRKKIAYLTVVYDDLPNLTSEDFDGMENLRLLDLSENKLSVLRRGTFNGLKKLKYLRFFNNTITDIEFGAFAELSSLKMLDLAENLLSVLRVGTLVGLFELETLYLYNNSITNVEFGAFVELITLKILDLSNNKISELHDRSFTGLEKLETLNISKNYISVLEIGIFTGLDKLQILDISDNDISVLEAGIFTGLKELQILDMSENKLSVLMDGTFIGLEELETINFENNKFTTLSNAFWNDGIATNVTIDLRMNPMQCTCNMTNEVAKFRARFKHALINYTCDATQVCCPKHDSPFILFLIIWILVAIIVIMMAFICCCCVCYYRRSVIICCGAETGKDERLENPEDESKSGNKWTLLKFRSQQNSSTNNNTEIDKSEVNDIQDATSASRLTSFKFQGNASKLDNGNIKMQTDRSGIKRVFRFNDLESGERMGSSMVQENQMSHHYGDISQEVNISKGRHVNKEIVETKDSISGNQYMKSRHQGYKDSKLDDNISNRESHEFNIDEGRMDNSTSSKRLDASNSSAKKFEHKREVTFNTSDDVSTHETDEHREAIHAYYLHALENVVNKLACHRCADMNVNVYGTRQKKEIKHGENDIATNRMCGQNDCIDIEVVRTVKHHHHHPSE